MVCTGDLINSLLIGFFGKNLAKSDHFMCQNRHLKKLFHLVIQRNAMVCIDKPEKIQPVLKIIPVICGVLSHEPLQASMDRVYRFHRVVIVRKFCVAFVVYTSSANPKVSIRILWLFSPSWISIELFFM